MINHNLDPHGFSSLSQTHIIHVGRQTCWKTNQDLSPNIKWTLICVRNANTVFPDIGAQTHYLSLANSSTPPVNRDLTDANKKRLNTRKFSAMSPCQLPDDIRRLSNKVSDAVVITHHETVSQLLAAHHTVSQLLYSTSAPISIMAQPV